MTDRHDALGRRLFASVRRERPSAELRERVLALGRAERERSHSGLVQRASLRERRTALWTVRRGIGWGLSLAAAAALVFAIARDNVDRPSIVMSAEQSGALVARGAPMLEHPGESSKSGPPEAPAPSPSSVEGSGAKHEKEERRAKPLQAESGKADAGPSRSEARSTLAVQLEQIKRARAALRAGEPIRALSLLDAYTARSGGGELGAEASLLRIEALAASGRRAEAARLARKFAVDHPNSPLIDRAMAFASE